MFNIAGNRCRMVVWINYQHRIVYVKFIGAQKEYNKIDIRTV